MIEAVFWVIVLALFGWWLAAKGCGCLVLLVGLFVALVIVASVAIAYQGIVTACGF